MQPYWCSKAYNLRFPRHELYPYILDTEELSRTNNGPTTYVKRRVKLDIEAPGWLKTVTGVHHCYFVEEHTYNKDERKVSFKTVNETFSHQVCLEEIATFEPHPDNPEWTLFLQTGTFSISLSQRCADSIHIGKHIWTRIKVGTVWHGTVQEEIWCRYRVDSDCFF